jgi:hypothetical protein
MRGLQWHFLGGLIVTLLIVGVGILMLLPLAGFDLTKYFSIIPSLGIPAEISYDTLPQQKSVADTPKSEHIITAEGDPYQPSEIGCAIADYIFKDYTGTGNTGGGGDVNTRKEPFVWNYGRTNSIVGSGTFILDDTQDDAGGAWETILSSRTPKCHYCDNFNKPNNFFTEVCINKNLKDRDYKGTPFCNSPISIDGTPYRFGNCRGFGCANDAVPGASTNCVNGANECNHCTGFTNAISGIEACSNNNWPNDDYCDNGESWKDDRNKIFWIVDTPSGDPPELVRDHINADTDWNANPISKKPYKYLYSVIWYAEAKRYDIEFVRVPITFSNNNFDWIKQEFSDYVRYNRGGWGSAAARMVKDVNVKLLAGTTKGEVLLRTEIGDFAGGDKPGGGKVIYESCTGKDACLDSSGGEPRKPDSSSFECYDSSQTSDLKDEKFLKESIRFKTNLPENGNFQDANTYTVRVYNWFGDRTEYGGWAGVHKHCYSLIDRTVSIYCTDCCNNDGKCNDPSPAGGSEDQDNCPADCP